MAWESQTNTDVKFVDWGKLKEGHDKDTTIVVKEKEAIQGIVIKISEHPTFGYTFRLKVKDVEKEVVLLGNKSLNRQMVTDDSDGFIPVKEGDEVRVKYNGMYTAESGTKGYNLSVAVNR